MTPRLWKPIWVTVLLPDPGLILQKECIMRKEIDFYFSFISLWSYIGIKPFYEMVDRIDVKINYKPVDLYTVFAATDGKPPKDRAIARQQYRLAEMARWKKIRHIPLNDNPKFYPVQPTHGHRMLLAAAKEGHDVRYFLQAALTAVWADELNLEDKETIIRLANESGLDGQRLYVEATAPDLYTEEKQLTDSAIERGVFGAPFFFHHDQPFWGQDRIDLLAMSLRGEI
jgi:2-hydroxychromene-2-carboxylate isomerase